MSCIITGREGIYITEIRDLGGCIRCVLGTKDISPKDNRPIKFAAQEQQFELVEQPKEKKIQRTGNTTGCAHERSPHNTSGF